MKPLPRLACVALLVRCAELMEAAIGELWWHVPEEMRQLFQAAVGGAVQTARSGQTAARLEETRTELTMLVGRFQLHFYDASLQPEMPESLTRLGEPRMRMISWVLDVGARAARAGASEKIQTAQDERLHGVSWGYTLAQELNDHNLEAELVETIRSLEACCQKNRLTDKSKVWWAGAGWNAAK